MLKIILGILVFILILGVIVLIHEGGHFFFARKAGILCYEFSIGMGPLIWQKKIGETYYSIRAIPIGGYVSMAGEEVENNLLSGYKYAKLTISEGLVTEIYAVKDLEDKFPADQNKEEFYQIISSDLIGSKEEIDEALYITILENGEEKRYAVKRDAIVRFGKKQAMQIAPYDRLFVNKGLLQRFLTIFAGPMMNFVLALVIFFAMGLVTGYTNYKTTVLGEVGTSSPAEVAGLEKSDKILQIGDQNCTVWNDISTILASYAAGSEAFDGSVMVTFERNGSTKTVKVNPNVFVNTIQIIFVADGSTSLIVDNYGEDTLSAKAGLKAGDELVSIKTEDGTVTNFNNRLEVLKYFDSGIGSVNQQFTLTVKRDGEEQTLEVIKSYPKQIFVDNNIEVCKVQLGISPTVTRNIGRVLLEPLKKIGSSCTVILKTLGALFRPKSGISIRDLSGPVGIASATVSIMDQGFLSILNWMAILSVNIGLMNIIPLPALDGGRLAFLLYELITRKKTNPKVENIIHTIGFIILMALFVFVAFNDVLRLFK